MDAVTAVAPACRAITFYLSRPGWHTLKHEYCHAFEFWHPAIRVTPHRNDSNSEAYGWYVTAVLTLGYTCAFVDRVVMGLLTPAIQADLAMSDTQAGLLQGLAFAMFYTLFGLPLGWLADIGNRKRLLAVGMTVWSIATASCGLAGGFGPLFAARVCVGIGEATLSPCAASLISDYFHPATRPKAFGFYGTGPALGSIISFTGGGLLYGALQSSSLLDLPFVGILKPWQEMFVLAGLMGLLPAILLSLTVREPRRRDAATTGVPVSRLLLMTYLRKNRVTLLYCFLGLSLVIMPVFAYVNWLPTLFLRSYGWSPAKFSVIYGLPAGLIGIVGSASAGYLASWLKRRGDQTGTLRACAIGSTLSAIGGVVTPFMPGAETALIACLITGGFGNYTTTLGLAAISEYTPREMRGRITAGFVLCTGLISSSLGPLIVGVISDAISENPNSIGIALALLAGGIALPGAFLIARGLGHFRNSVNQFSGET